MNTPLVWDVDPVIFSLGFFQLRWYSLCFLMAFVCGLQIVKAMFRWEKYPEQEAEDMLIYVLLGTIIGARLGHCLFYEPLHYLKNPLEIFMVWKGGLASHGGFLGVIIAIAIYTWRRQQSLLWACDRLSVPCMLAAAWIRLGNFFNSEVIGTPSDLPWAVVFSRVDNIARHPSQIYESLTYLGVFVCGALIYRFTTARLYTGRIFGIMLTMGFGSRFLLEVFKENQETFEENMLINMGQILSLPFVLVAMYLIFRKSTPNNPNNTKTQKNNSSKKLQKSLS